MILKNNNIVGAEYTAYIYPQNHTVLGSLLPSRFVGDGAEVTWVLATEG